MLLTFGQNRGEICDADTLVRVLLTVDKKCVGNCGQECPHHVSDQMSVPFEGSLYPRCDLEFLLYPGEIERDSGRADEVLGIRPGMASAIEFWVRHDSLRYEMELTISDLPLMIEEILDALNREESVTLTHEGQIKGTIIPSTSDEAATQKNGKTMSVRNHPLFGSISMRRQEVDDLMDNLRKPRFVLVNNARQYRS